eukprot:5730202-Karenia_brevis.AAC.1
MDRSYWLENMLQSGSWEGIKKFRKGFKSQLGKLRNLEGMLVESDARSDTMAEYFHKVQWQ